MSAPRVVLTPKQQKQVAAAAPADRAKLAQSFRAQTALLRMPRASAGKRGVMPDVTKYHFGQTPASSNVIAPRGFGYYDAFAHDPASACTAFSVGPATGVTGTSRHTVTTKHPSTTGGGAVLTIIAPTLTNIQGITYFADAAGALTYTTASSPQLVADPPSTAIPTRCSLRLRNVSPQFTKGGIVRTLRITTGFTLPSTLAELDAFCELIRSHDRTRTYSGAALSEDFQINCTVADQTRATSFLDWVNITGQLDCNTTPQFCDAMHTPTYTPIALLFEPFSGFVDSSTLTNTPNTYEITIRSQFLGRYPQGTMLANLAVPPRAIGDQTNIIRNREEAKGSALHPVTAEGLEAGENFLTKLSEQLPFMDYAWKKETGLSVGDTAKIFRSSLVKGKPGR